MSTWLGYRQSITPARLGGKIADMFGFRTALRVAIVGLAVVGVWFGLSPMRDAQIDEHASS